MLTPSEWVAFGLGIIAIAVACVAAGLEYYHSRQVKKHNLAEKSAMIFGYAREIEQPGYSYSENHFWRIFSDIKAIQQLHGTMNREQEALLRSAGWAMFQAMQMPNKVPAERVAYLNNEFERIFAKRYQYRRL